MYIDVIDGFLDTQKVAQSVLALQCSTCIVMWRFFAWMCAGSRRLGRANDYPECCSFYAPQLGRFCVRTESSLPSAVGVIVVRAATVYTPFLVLCRSGVKHIRIRPNKNSAFFLKLCGQPVEQSLSHAGHEIIEETHTKHTFEPQFTAPYPPRHHHHHHHHHTCGFRVNGLI